MKTSSILTIAWILSLMNFIILLLLDNNSILYIIVLLSNISLVASISVLAEGLTKKYE